MKSLYNCATIASNYSTKGKIQLYKLQQRGFLMTPFNQQTIQPGAEIHNKYCFWRHKAALRLWLRVKEEKTQEINQIPDSTQ